MKLYSAVIFLPEVFENSTSSSDNTTNLSSHKKDTMLRSMVEFKKKKNN